MEMDPDKVIPDQSLSVKNGAIPAIRRGPRHLIMYYNMLLRKLAEQYQAPDMLTKPWRELPKNIQQLILYGSGTTPLEFDYYIHRKKFHWSKPFEGILALLKKRYEETEAEAVRERLQQLLSPKICPACHGTGFKITHPCKSCSGTGRVKVDKEIMIHIPPGVDNGSKLRIAREGEAGTNGGAPGNLYVIIAVRPDDLFQRDGTNTLCELPIDVNTAVSGGIVQVPTINGLAKMRIPEGTQNGTTLRLKGKGIPALKGGIRGDHLVKVMVETPANLSKQQKDLLRYYNDSLTPQNNPLKTAFEQKIRRRFPG